MMASKADHHGTENNSIEDLQLRSEQVTKALETPVAREIEGLALRVMNQLCAQQTESYFKLRTDDLLIPSCYSNLIRA